MSENKSFSTIRPPRLVKRSFESDTMALQALRLIAAPNPKDDLSDAELGVHLRKNKYSADMIQSIIDTVKAL